MRVEPYAIHSYVHAIKRGARGFPITGDDSDKRRSSGLLFYMNDEFLDEDWQTASFRGSFFRPDTWPERKPLVSIVAYTLMTNHLHLLLKEIKEGGISSFMRKIGQSMTNHFNEKYDQRGSLFQGSYRARTVQNDEYLRYVSAYIMVKNVFELYPKGGLKAAQAHFEDAWAWAISYPYSSLGEYVGAMPVHIVDQDEISRTFPDAEEFKEFARDVIAGGRWTESEFE